MSLAACSNVTQPDAVKPATAVEQASEVRCARGLTRIELIGGLEDGFAASGSEPSRVRPARLPNPYLDTLIKAQSGVIRLRDYDETGQDRILIDHFSVPRDIVSGAVVIRLRTTGGSSNDAVRLGNLDERAFINGFAKAESYLINLKSVAGRTSAASAGEVITVPFDKLTTNARAEFKGSFIDYLNRADRPDAVDLEVEDDTAIDVFMLVLCQQPQTKRGTSFSEFRTKLVAADVSLLTCALDKTQEPCNPFVGDKLCTAELPVACYKPGARVPANLNQAGLGAGYATGGEVRATPAIAASGFQTRTDADRYCSAQFGAGWRILEYHDGSSGAIVTYSAIAPMTRLWVDVRDQRYANCWDRDKAR